jgi:competence protein ComEC
MPRAGWIACGAVGGALTVTSGDRIAVAVALAIAAAALLVAALLGRWRTVTLALVFGALAVAIRGLSMPLAPGLVGAPGDAGPWPMIVESIGSPRGGHQVATLRTLDAGPAGFRLAATLPRYPPIEPGDRIEVDGRSRARPDSPYGRYLERIGAWGTLDARSLSLLERPADPAAMLERLRRGAGDLLTRVLPEPEAGLAAGILIGLRDRVDRTVADAFTTAGVSHVVAISGWNIAIVAAAIAAIAGRLGRRRRAVVTIVAIIAYVCFAGASASVLRAGAMAGVVLLARESGRAGRAAAALGWAAALLLFIDPRLVADAGFQLSTLATAGLIAWATPLTELLDRRTGGRLPRWLSESLGISLAAQVATLPVVLASFGRLALISPVVNLVVVPLVAPAMAAGVVALVGGAIVVAGGPSAIGAVLAAPGWVALRLIIGIVDIAAALPLASVSLEPPWGGLTALASVAVGTVMVVWRQRRRPTAASRKDRAAVGERAVVERAASGERSVRPSRWMRVAVAVLVVAVTVTGAVIVSRSAGVARVTVLDVGQGDAILVEGSKGGRLLVDGGPDPDRLLVELDRRLPPWDRRIDALILTHPHEDHVAGLALLLDRYAVARVFEPGMRGPGPGYAAWLDRVTLADTRTRLSIGAGDRLAVDEIDLRVLWPIRGQVPDEPPDTGTGINNVSVVLLGTVGARRFLLAGDAEEDVDPSLLADGLPTVDLLKVAHHGSRTATTEAFVSTVRPRVAIASAGTGNPYGHPARATLERLAASGARVYRTDEDGTVTVTFDVAGMSVGATPRRGAVAVPLAARSGRASSAVSTPRAFLCDIPRQPFLPEPPRPTIRHDAGPGATLGYHRADDDRRPTDRVWPALPPPVDSRRRWAAT